MSKTNGSVRQRQTNGKLPDIANGATIAGKNDIAIKTAKDADESGSMLKFFICVGGIYASLYAHLRFMIL